MNQIYRQFLIASAISLGAWMPCSAHAQSTNDHAHSHGAVQPDMADGVVRKVDAENGKITIQHGEIRHLDMAAMTMVFSVKDKAMLANAKPGDQVRFLVIREAGKLLITEIQPVR